MWYVIDSKDQQGFLHTLATTERQEPGTSRQDKYNNTLTILAIFLETEDYAEARRIAIGRRFKNKKYNITIDPDYKPSCFKGHASKSAAPITPGVHLA